MAREVMTKNAGVFTLVDPREGDVVAKLELDRKADRERDAQAIREAQIRYLLTGSWVAPMHVAKVMREPGHIPDDVRAEADRRRAAERDARLERDAKRKDAIARVERDLAKRTKDVAKDFDARWKAAILEAAEQVARSQLEHEHGLHNFPARAALTPDEVIRAFVRGVTR